MNSAKSVVMRILRECQMPPVKWSIDFLERAPSKWHHWNPGNHSTDMDSRSVFAFFLAFAHITAATACSAQTHYPTVRSTYLNIMSIHWHKLTARRKVQPLVYYYFFFRLLILNQPIHLNGSRPTCAPFSSFHCCEHQTRITQSIHRLLSFPTESIDGRRHENLTKSRRIERSNPIFVIRFFFFFSCWIWYKKLVYIWRWETEDVVATAVATTIACYIYMCCLVVIVVAPRITFPFFSFFFSSLRSISLCFGRDPPEYQLPLSHPAIERSK